jgi:hypothetical protein
MSVNTVILQDWFTSDGTDRLLSIPSGVDWIQVINFTQYGDTNDAGIKFYWQAGMPDGSGIREAKTAGGDGTLSTVIAAPEGFTIIDQSLSPLGPQIAVTAGTNATQPVISTADTTGLVEGSIIRLSSDGGTTAPNLSGVDFEIDNIVANTSFRIRNALANVPGAVFGTGNYRHIKWDPLYYPRTRFIVDISQAQQGVVTTSVPHGYEVGQNIAFKVRPEFGMTELDGITATVVAVTRATFTIDLDTSAFTAFVWPDAAGFTALSWARTTPASFNTSEALIQGVNTLAGAVENRGIRGVMLAAGADSPAGANGDLIFWRAGRSELGPRSA